MLRVVKRNELPQKRFALEPYVGSMSDAQQLRHFELSKLELLFPESFDFGPGHCFGFAFHICHRFSC